MMGRQWLGAWGLAALLAACGAGSKDIEGVLSAPSGGSVAGSLVLVCPAEAGEPSCEDPRAKQIAIGASGRSAPYKVEGLEDIDYLVLAFKDNDRDGRPSEGDYLGYYGYPGRPKLVRPPAKGVDLRMDVLTSQASGAVPLLPK